ncbi:MAG TPA: signal recognition particle protein [Pirellulaceae bacterium]|nr:signal recognition particle protein [Pirellulaceae bacterium]
MFESLQTGLQSAWKSLTGKARLSEANMRDGLKIVEQSLLEADVSYSVVQELMARISEKALGEKVLNALNPTQHFIGIVRDELVNILGPVDPSLHLKQDVNVLMLCGLQGSGKTTTCGKLSRLIIENKVKPMMVAADLQRPAAIEQLHVIGRQLDVPVYSEPGAKDPVKVCQDGIRKAKELGAQVVILDTAGRLAIDAELMKQLQEIDKRVQPDQVYLVVDGMTGQDAVNSAKAFNEALELNGVIMTKLDGDARGGALLSVKQVTGVPIKFIGTGEHLESLEPFRPEGMVGRILGMGDMLGLVDTVRRAVDVEQQQELEKKLQAGEFTLDDFKGQMRMILQPGLMQRMLSLLPLPAEMKSMMGGGGEHEGDIKRLVGVIDSMTPQERRVPKIIDPARRNRIARGAGVQIQDVNHVLKMYDMMSPMLKAMSGKGVGARMQAIQEMQKSGMLDPGAKVARPKGDTGKRLTPKERKEMQKRREKELRRKKRMERDQRNQPEEDDSENPRGDVA